MDKAREGALAAAATREGLMFPRLDFVLFFSPRKLLLKLFRDESHTSNETSSAVPLAASDGRPGNLGQSSRARLQHGQKGHPPKHHLGGLTRHESQDGAQGQVIGAGGFVDSSAQRCKARLRPLRQVGRP